ncbi:hypothetical protein [Methylovulum sp.]|uniref:hypothetical protein n=1 Tax=Methylovulum sp. TaxID=1916980 RepID=UPI0026302477|nr:hypothetical protein [Methylovulum sp.]MDD5125028.1 hypothetical protein [Methylovulum sp.]
MTAQRQPPTPNTHQAACALGGQPSPSNTPVPDRLRRKRKRPMDRPPRCHGAKTRHGDNREETAQQRGPYTANAA